MGVCLIALAIVLTWDSVAHSLMYWLIGSIPVGGLAMTLYAIRQYDGSRIVVSAGTITLQKWFEQPKAVVVQDVARIVLCSVGTETQAAMVPERAAFLLGRDGRCMMSFYARRWNQNQLDLLWQRIGIAPEGSWSHLLWYSELNTVFPHAFDSPPLFES